MPSCGQSSWSERALLCLAIFSSFCYAQGAAMRHLCGLITPAAEPGWPFDICSDWWQQPPGTYSSRPPVIWLCADGSFSNGKHAVHPTACHLFCSCGRSNTAKSLLKLHRQFLRACPEAISCALASQAQIQLCLCVPAPCPMCLGLPDTWHCSSFRASVATHDLPLKLMP